MNKAINLIRKVLFGDWNGLQILLFPTSIFLVLDSYSFLFWMYNILVGQIHLLPLILFLLTCELIFFVIIKYSSFINPDNSQAQHRKELRKFIIDLHQGLFMVLMIGMVVFVFKNFMGYFYQIDIPIKRIYSHFFQYIAVTIFMFYYIQSLWTKPYRKSGVSYTRAINQVMVFARRNILSTLLYTLQIILITVFFCLAYYYFAKYAMIPGVDWVQAALGINLRLEMIVVSNMFVLVYDVFLLFAAFLLSNLLFYPFMYLGSKLIMHLHPIVQRNLNAQKKS